MTTDHPRERLRRLVYDSGATDATIVRYLRGTGTAIHPLDNGWPLRDYSIASRAPGLVELARWCDFLERLIAEQNKPPWKLTA